jgi:hypothetical protein
MTRDQRSPDALPPVLPSELGAERYERLQLFWDIAVAIYGFAASLFSMRRWMRLSAQPTPRGLAAVD